MGTLHCDGGTGTYLSNTLTVSLNTPYDCPANWTTASPSPLLWVGVIADGSDYKMKFWDDNPTDTYDLSTTATATTNFTGSPLEFQIAQVAGGITNVSPDPNGFDGPQNLVIYDSNGQPSHGVKFKFVPTSSGGAGTLSASDTASFAGTTPQQIQWAITVGSSPTPNATYYLFNETPGGVALGTPINVGPNPVSGMTSTVTYINPSGADFTGVWYVGYGQNSTRVNLATYNFSSNRKVFCNFW